MEKCPDGYVRLPYWWWESLGEFYIEYFAAIERFDIYNEAADELFDKGTD